MKFCKVTSDKPTEYLAGITSPPPQWHLISPTIGFNPDNGVRLLVIFI